MKPNPRLQFGKPAQPAVRPLRAVAIIFLSIALASGLYAVSVLILP
jgi:hypothetical protein